MIGEFFRPINMVKEIELICIPVYQLLRCFEYKGGISALLTKIIILYNL
jgi:hypothetical protein